MNGRLRVAASLWMGLAGCAPAPAAKPKQAMAPIRRIFVQKFDGDGGAEAANQMARAIKGYGLELVSAPQADAVLTGTVTEYKSGRKMVIILGNAHPVIVNGSSVTVSNPVITAGSPNPGLGLNNPQVIAENALAGVSARLREGSSGRVVWTGEFSYESLELQDALQSAVSVLAQSLRAATPRLQREAPVPKG